MDPRASALAELTPVSEHPLKAELYSLVKANSEIFEFLQAGSLDGIWYLDLEHPGEGWMSERYKSLFGYQDHEIPNNSLWWRGNVFPEDLPAVLDNFARHSADPGVPFDQILRHRHKDGSAVWVRCRGYAIRDGSGKPIRMLGAHTDITAFKRTEQELRALHDQAAAREREHSFRQLTESLPQLVWTSAPDGACDYLSPQWVAYTGLAEAEQLGRDWLNQIHPDDRDPLMAAWSASLRNIQPFNFEYRIRRHDGIYRWFDTRAVPLRDSETRILKWFGTCTDVTERKQVEADQRFLLQLTVHLQAAGSMDAVAANMTRVMAEHFQADRCILYATSPEQDQLALLHEFTKSAARPLNAWGSEEIRSTLAQGKAVAVADTSAHPFTAARYQSDFQPAGMGSFVVAPMRRFGELVCVLCLSEREPRRWTQREIHLAQTATERIWLGYETWRAITAERAMHETLAASEQRLQLALQAGAIGIWETDSVANTNTWDAHSRSIFGFPPDLAINGEIVMSCIHPDDREAVQRNIETRHDPGETGRFEADYRIIRFNGTGIRHVYAQGQWFYEGEGESRRPVRAIGTVQDVTALKRGEQALRRANLELEQFAYAAAHDLQEPLRNVGLATQILAGRYRGKFDADADSLLNTAVEGPIRMQAMVKDLLAYSRAVVLEEDAILLADPNAVLADVLSNLSTLIEEKRALIMAETLPPLRMSETHLLQLLQNLISNSVKYSGNRQPQIHISAASRAGECVFAVKDNGIGIAPEFRERVFGVFKRLHSKDIPGTGIGLALCKRIVEHYGGRIWIESNGEDGTSVLFTPPLAG
jgi:PAS domain S-box-containing protein